MDHSWLTDEQSAKIAPHLPTDTRGKERVDDPRVIGGIGHGLKSGGRRADAPREIYGPKKIVDRFMRWAGKDGRSVRSSGSGWRTAGPGSDRPIRGGGPSLFHGRRRGEPMRASGRSRGGRTAGIHAPPRPRLPPARFPADRRADRRLHGWCGRFLGSPAEDRGLIGPFARTVVLPRRATL